MHIPGLSLKNRFEFYCWHKKRNSCFHFHFHFFFLFAGWQCDISVVVLIFMPNARDANVYLKQAHSTSSENDVFNQMEMVRRRKEKETQKNNTNSNEKRFCFYFMSIYSRGKYEKETSPKFATIFFMHEKYFYGFCYCLLAMFLFFWFQLQWSVIANNADLYMEKEIVWGRWKKIIFIFTWIHNNFLLLLSTGGASVFVSHTFFSACQCESK